MTDIVKRLRWLAKEDPWRPRVEIAAQAADEIERLRDVIVLLEATGTEATDEIERLRTALRQIADGWAINAFNMQRIARAALGEDMT